MKRALLFVICAGCGSSTATDMMMGGDTPVSSVPLGDTIQASQLKGPVDVVRDEFGVPHIYGGDIADVAYAEGYMMAADRLVQMDLARHQGDGTLTELFGVAIPSLLDSDVAIRAHHLRAQAQAAFDAMKTSSDPSDQALVASLGRFADGVNAYLSDLRSGAHGWSLPGQLAFLYDPSTTKPWTEVDSLLLGQYELFLLSFDADTEIYLSQVEANANLKFDQSNDPQLKARAGIAQDFQILAPTDPTHTISGWTGMNGDTSHASLLRPRGDALLALLEADRPSVVGVGNDHLLDPERGSNNWVIGPSLTQSGHVLVANDTHLQLSNPSVFYLVHLKAGGAIPVNTMGVQLAGVPAIALGMNEHIAWGATVNNIDVTDVYQETLVPCNNPAIPCVMFNGQKVPLMPRVEKFNIGQYGKIQRTLSLTLYDVPHHGPIIPRVVNHDALDPLGSSELSIRYTGHEPARLLPAFFGVVTAKNMQEAVASLDANLKYGSQNWVIGDDGGHFGWTQIIRVPRRAAGHAPWKVLPGDGTAEWGPDMDPKYIPHAYDPAQGYIVTANNDPIGVTDDGDPFFDEPMVDGAPLYLGALYDPGTRVGRATARIKDATSGGKKLSLDDMLAIQSDAISEHGQIVAPTLVDAAKALGEEIAQPGMHPELTQIAMNASAQAKAALPKALALVQGWTFDTPAASDEEMPTAAEIADSGATTVTMVFLPRLVQRAVGDERAVLGQGVDDFFDLKLVERMCAHPELLKTGVAQQTGDALLWDDLNTQPIEGKRAIAAAALVDALDFVVGKMGADPNGWRWGKVHTLTLDFPAPMDALKIPLKTDPNFPNGYPRHGTIGTVDVGGFGLGGTDFTYAHGPAIRFSCELAPDGPHGRNALPGGEIFDPSSPHYSDQMQKWRKNQTFPLAFTDDEVVKSANTEYSARNIGRIRFTP